MRLLEMVSILLDLLAESIGGLNGVAGEGYVLERNLFSETDGHVNRVYLEVANPCSFSNG